MLFLIFSFYPPLIYSKYSENANLKTKKVKMNLANYIQELIEANEE